MVIFHPLYCAYTGPCWPGRAGSILARTSWFWWSSLCFTHMHELSTETGRANFYKQTCQYIPQFYILCFYSYFLKAKTFTGNYAKTQKYVKKLLVCNVVKYIFKTKNAASIHVKTHICYDCNKFIKAKTTSTKCI